MASKLTEEQQKMIEEKRKQALSKRTMKQQQFVVQTQFQQHQQWQPPQQKDSSSTRFTSSNSVRSSADERSSPSKIGSMGLLIRGRCVASPDNQRFSVEVGYHAKLIEIFKKMKTKKYDPITKRWSFNMSEYKHLMTSVKVLGSSVQLSPVQSSASSSDLAVSPATVPSPSSSGGDSSGSSKPPALTKGSCVLVDSSRFVVNIGYHSRVVDLFKTMETRTYDASTKKWLFHLKEYSKLVKGLKMIPNVFIEPLPNPVLKAFKAEINHGKVKMESLTSSEANLSSLDSKLVNSLLMFQREGVNFAIARGGRALIADDMGLGKTIQAIAVACYYRTEWPLLIVVPSSLRMTWSEALLRWVPSLDESSVRVIMTSRESCTQGLITITSYDLMVKHAAQLKKRNFQVVIMDESHFLKNYKTARCQAAMPLLRLAPRAILLSGTPALSRPAELYSQVKAIDPKLFPSFHEFGLRYCNAQKNAWGWDYQGSSNMAELQLLLEKSIMIRRLKTEVMTQLPSKTREMIILDPGLVKINTAAMKSAVNEMDKSKVTRKESTGALLMYFCETGTAKINAIKDYMADLLEMGHKFLVFAHHQNVLDSICHLLTHKGCAFIRIDGKTPADRRQDYCDLFQRNEDYRVAVLSVTAANTGLTLTSASLVIFAELFWNPGVLVQAEDRVYRIGQQNAVNIRYLVAKSTADDFIWPLVKKKLNVLSQAGLTKDDFSQAGITEFQDPNTESILDYFEETFPEAPFLNGKNDNRGENSHSSCDWLTQIEKDHQQPTSRDEKIPNYNDVKQQTKSSSYFTNSESKVPNSHIEKKQRLT